MGQRNVCTMRPTQGQPGEQRHNRRPRSHPIPDTALAVCDGCVQVGCIVQRGGKQHAFNASGKLIGSYPSQIEAMRSIPGAAS